LEPCLTGKSKIAIICTISPALSNYEESLSTLKFAARAKLIRTKVQLEPEDDKTVLMKYKKEIDELRKQLEVAQSNEEKLRTYEEQITAQKSEVAEVI